MCNACGFQCCGSDMFGGCGCDGCDCEECWSDDEEEGDESAFYVMQSEVAEDDLLAAGTHYLDASGVCRPKA